MIEKFSTKFIAATKEMSSLYRAVPSPYLRKTLSLDKKVKTAILTVCGLGFYRFWLNGEECTKGFLSPYITNPDNILDYDQYDITSVLRQGKNALAFQLGNGMQNAFGGFVWRFEEAAFRSAPKIAMCLNVEYTDGTVEIYEADESFVWHSSPLIKDDLRMGEIYDANDEIEGWKEVDFDDSAWQNAIFADTPKGKPVLCTAKPIVETHTLQPVSIRFGKWIPGISKIPHYGYIYDFGYNTAGVVTLKIKGRKGQKITLTFGEVLHGGDFYTDNISFVRDSFLEKPDYVQQDVYICKGEGIEEYRPQFTYHAYQYIFVEGIDEEQATEDLLTYNVMHTALEEKGSFSCSCEKLNRLQAMTRNATLSNFWHFPNDCPHREKNGWTADAALSAEHTLLNLNPYDNYYEWMRHICGALNEQGALPGIVPTGGWGFAWGNGPAWDAVIVELPYMTYRYTGNKGIVEESMDGIMRYVRYLETRTDEKGLIAIGLGDWVAPNGIKSPLIFTDSVESMDICNKAAFLANICGRKEDSEYCKAFATRLKESIRTNLVDLHSGVVVGECETSQAMAIYYGVVEGEEKEKAFAKLLKYIQAENNHLDTGVLGARVIFHVLAENGYADLAYAMIVEPTPPSYGYWLGKGYTALAEDFWTDEQQICSKNHHFWGDISAFFIKRICGINYNPNGDDFSYVALKPHFISALNHAEAYHDSPKGKIEVKWQKEGGMVAFTVKIPENMRYDITFADGYEEVSREQTSEGIKIILK